MVGKVANGMAQGVKELLQIQSVPATLSRPDAMPSTDAIDKASRLAQIESILTDFKARKQLLTEL